MRHRRQSKFDMNKTLIITTDLGTFKAFEVIERLQASSRSLLDLDSFETVHADNRISRRLANQAGQFGKGATSFAAINDGANGERHNIQLEDNRRSLEIIASRIQEIVSDPKVDAWFFAAPAEINAAILNRVSATAKAKIVRNLKCNLVNAPKDDLIERFLN
jgi:hypothetical protein